MLRAHPRAQHFLYFFRLGRGGLGQFWFPAPQGPGGPMGAHGGPWGPMGTHGDPWEPMGTHGDPWGPMGTHGDPWPMGPMGPWVNFEAIRFLEGNTLRC